MGTIIDRDTFSEAEYVHFAGKLGENLAALKDILLRPGFGEGPATLGAELEVSIVDRKAHALPLNRQVIEGQPDPRLQLELDRFNIEYNLFPRPLAGKPFSALEKDLGEGLRLLETRARALGGRIVSIGILPTLRDEDISLAALTDIPRYKALSRGIKRIRREPFRLRIDGPEPLDTEAADVTFEGANTSLQIHLRVSPSEFADTYNAIQMATPLALVIGANSPLFLGHLLWDETRVALFKQSIDTRSRDALSWHAPARVSFGHGWLREGAFELFAEASTLFPPLLPIVTQEDPVACVKSGGLPKLEELRLHLSTVWRWNRAVYDSESGGHIRIEMRALPSGPTPRDMAVNTAFLVGLALGLKPVVGELLHAFPFEYAHYNFYRAAQRGFDARLLWPSHQAPSPRERSAHDLIRELLPVAERGLESAGVDWADIRMMTDLVRARLDWNMNGARWQRAALSRLDRDRDRPEALAELLELYLAEASRGVPVTEWSLPA